MDRPWGFRVSYDLLLFRAVPGVGLLEAATAVMESEQDDVNPGPIDPTAEARKRALESALRALNPSLESFVFDYAEIAEMENVTEAEARRRWRHIEMNGPEDGNGIQITLDDESVSVTVPYWHRGNEARAVWSEIWMYLGALEQAGTFHTYDPQLGRIVDLKKDLEAVLVAYAGGADFTASVAAEQLPKPR